ncbi:hypothetical protein [Streptomyces sp. NPDC090080]|uniref:hypothetical protein n=1 Tax=Streptomyces sp. NPDC090080 TaxID=3365939 RepID=UPI00381175F3
MTRTLAAAAALVATLTVAGCSSDSIDGAAPGPVPTVAPTEQFINSVIDAHLDSYASGVPAVPPADELEAFPPKWCDALAAGHSVEWMLDDSDDLYPVGENWGTEKADAYQLVVLGVVAYCPRYSAVVKKELREAGAY